MIIIDQNVLLILGVYGAVAFAAFTLALMAWVYRDMKSRTRDRLAALFMLLVVAVLNVPGLLIYLLIRPRETLSEAYERSLEEEALLQEIEEKPTCPGCSQRVQHDWQICPNCHTRLKKICTVCSHMLELSWTVCPHCASVQSRYMPEDEVINASRHIQRSAPEAPRIAEKWLNKGQSAATSRGGAPEFVEGEP